MKTIYNHITNSEARGEKLLAVLIDPDKIQLHGIAGFIRKINHSAVTHIFVGGSWVEDGKTTAVVKEIKKYTILPVVLFPGSINQITPLADGLLFLSLLSGRNPEYLIGQQVKAVPRLKNIPLEVIPTGYILIDGGTETSTQKVSKTRPLPPSNTEIIVNTALAGQYLGMQLIYLEAGSGAKNPVPHEVVKEVAENISVPLIVGGGIRCFDALEKVYNAGATMVVIGTAFENDPDFFSKIKFSSQENKG